MNPQQTSKPNMWPSIISGASSLLGGILSINEAKKNRKFQAEQAQLNRQFNHDEAQMNRDFQYDMFNKTNEYNDPSKVVNRFKNAGLNPALAFGGFSNAMAPSGSSASSSASPSGSVPDLNGITSAGSNAMAAMNQAKLADAQARLANSEAKKNETELPYLDRRNQLINEGMQYGIDLTKSQELLTEKNIAKTEAEMQQIKANVDFIKANANKALQEIELLKKENAYYKLTKSAEFAQIQSVIDKNYSEARLNDEQKAKLGVLIAAQAASYYASANLSNSQAALNQFQVQINDATLKQAGLDNLAEWQVNKLQRSSQTEGYGPFAGFKAAAVDIVKLIGAIIGIPKENIVF